MACFPPTSHIVHHSVGAMLGPTCTSGRNVMGPTPVTGFSKIGQWSLSWPSPLLRHHTSSRILVLSAYPCFKLRISRHNFCIFTWICCTHNPGSCIRVSCSRIAISSALASLSRPMWLMVIFWFFPVVALSFRHNCRLGNCLSWWWFLFLCEFSAGWFIVPHLLSTAQGTETIVSTASQVFAPLVRGQIIPASSGCKHFWSI